MGRTKFALGTGAASYYDCDLKGDRDYSPGAQMTVFWQNQYMWQWGWGDYMGAFGTRNFLNGFRRVLKFVDVFDNYLIFCPNIDNIFAFSGVYYEFKIILNTALKVYANK